jgi:hypothetical protein
MGLPEVVAGRAVAKLDADPQGDRWARRKAARRSDAMAAAAGLLVSAIMVVAGLSSGVEAVGVVCADAGIFGGIAAAIFVRKSMSVRLRNALRDRLDDRFGWQPRVGAPHPADRTDAYDRFTAVCRPHGEHLHVVIAKHSVDKRSVWQTHYLKLRWKADPDDERAVQLIVARAQRIAAQLTQRAAHLALQATPAHQLAAQVCPEDPQMAFKVGAELHRERVQHAQLVAARVQAQLTTAAGS